MKPDKAVIYFTVCSGTGYGIITSLIFILINNNLDLNIQIKITLFIVSFFLIISGLLASTIHLGHPKRAWRALSQWQSSWLSREGIAAIFTFIPLSLFFIFWIISDYNATYYLLIFSSICSVITVFCTAKIYSTLKSIPAWNNPFVSIIYILNSLVMGSIFTYTILYFFNHDNKFLSNFIIVISITALFIKLLYWYSIKIPSKSNIATATGLGTDKKTSFFEGPHTGKNYLTSEMINNIKKSKSFILRLSMCIFTYITPCFYLIQNHNLIISQNIISISLIIISSIAMLGMFIERYLFFIEANHSVSLYYGNKTI